jgi:hypothetical protein
VLLTALASPSPAADDPSRKKSPDVLEGVLRVHPKFHYRYYIAGFGDGQHCALFGADEQFKKIAPGTRVRVQGELAARFFGNTADPTPALVSTWIIYMDVDKVELLRDRVETR